MVVARSMSKPNWLDSRTVASTMARSTFLNPSFSAKKSRRVLGQEEDAPAALVSARG